MAFLELKKYRESSKDKVRKPWLEFFGNKPFTQQPERAISQADQLLDYKSWSEEDRKMFSQLRMREEQALLAQDYALEQAEEKGLERGLERGRAEGIEKGLERGLERGRAEGIEQGRAEGIEKGLERGLERGRAEGIEQGLEQGLERGKVEGSLSMLLNLVHQGLLTPEVASQQLGMSVVELEALLKDYHK